MTKQQLDAIRLLGVCTAYRFDPLTLSGNTKASCRAHIMSVLHDKKIPQSKNGVNAMIESLHAINPPQGDCSAAQKDNFAKWYKTVIDNATGFPPH